MNIVKSIFILVAVLSLVTMSTHSVFTSQASIDGNQFSTGTWQTPTPTPSSSVSVNVRICHATGQEGQYQQISPNAQGVINGHVDHQDIEDIIPPFDYGDPTVHFIGQNWDAKGQAIYDNNCEILAGPLGATILVSPSPSPTPLESPSPKETPIETSSPLLTN